MFTEEIQPTKQCQASKTLCQCTYPNTSTKVKTDKPNPSCQMSNAHNRSQYNAGTLFCIGKPPFVTGALPNMKKTHQDDQAQHHYIRIHGIQKFLSSIPSCTSLMNASYLYSWEWTVMHLQCCAICCQHITAMQHVSCDFILQTSPFWHVVILSGLCHQWESWTIDCLSSVIHTSRSHKRQRTNSVRAWYIKCRTGYEL